MKDRSVDVSLTNKGSSTSQAYYRGLPYGAPTVEVTNASAYRRKRVPAGGKAKPEVEKPFYNLTITTNYPRGRWVSGVRNFSSYERSGNLSSAYAGYPGTFQGGLPYPHAPPGGIPEFWPSSVPGWNPDLLSQAEVRAMNKLRDVSGQTDFDAGLFYMERRETSRMFMQAMQGMSRLAQAIARKDYEASARILRDAFAIPATAGGERARQRRLERWLRKEVSKTPSLAKRVWSSLEDLVLGYNLGLSPLLSDLDSAYKALVYGDLTVKTVVKSHGTVSRVRNDMQETKLGLGTQTSTLSEVSKYVVTLKAIPRQTVRAKLSALGLGSAPRLVWNATRLTFMIDYWIAMGPFLSALDIPLEFEFYQGSRSLRNRRVVTTSVKSPVGEVRGDYSLVFLERKVYGSFPVPIPPLSFRQKDFTGKQLVNSGLIYLKSFRSLVGR